MESVETIKDKYGTPIQMDLLADEVIGEILVSFLQSHFFHLSEDFYSCYSYRNDKISDWFKLKAIAEDK